jgi:plastocyanin
LTCIAAGAFALAAFPAFAGDHIVTAFSGPFRFEPATLEIAVGDTVTFVNGGGFHNVKSDPDAVTEFRCADGCDETGGNGDLSSDAWEATVAFPTAGTAGYYCEQHGGAGGAGMSGLITIVGGTPTAEISVDPALLQGSAEVGASTTLALEIGNTGDADLTWTADVATTDCATPDTVPWLALAPANGTVTVGAAATTVDVTLDAAALTAGVYDANVCVQSNDPVNDLVTVPVNFLVSEPDLIFANGFDLDE